MGSKILISSLAFIATGCSSSGSSSNIELSNAPEPATAAELDELSISVTRQALACWVGVSDLPYSDQLAVRMAVMLNVDGKVVDLRLVEPLRRPVGSGAMAVAIDRAMRGARKCSPYEVPAAMGPDDAFYAEIEFRQ